MSLEGARLRYEDENGETVVLAAKGRTFQVGSYYNCDLLLPQEERLICEINCDAFGRVIIYNKSSEDPIQLNDVVIHGKRPLLHGGKITIRDKVYTWEFPKSSEAPDAPCTPERLPASEQAPNSCPSLRQSPRLQIEKRLTVHNFHYSINSDDEGNTSIESRDQSESHLEEDALNISPPPSAEVTTCETPKVDLLEATQNKENTATPPGSHQKLLKLCALSDVVITSFSPRETGVKVEKSFTCVRKPTHAASTSTSVTVSTPKSVYSTPKGGVLSELNEDSCSRDLMDFGTPSTSTKVKRASSMFLIDLTTPSKLRPTPKQTLTPKQTPISVDSTDESSDASPLVIDITNSETPPSPGPSQRYKTPHRPAGTAGATPKRTPQSLMKRALLTSTKKQIAANQTDKTTPVATAKRQSLLEARRQCLTTPRRLPFHPHRRTPVNRPEEQPRGKVPKTSPRRRISLMESPRENKVSQLRKSFAAAKRSPGVDKSNKLVAKARRSLNSPKSGSPMPGSPKPTSPCPRKTFNASQIKSSTPEKPDDSNSELSRTFTIMDDTQGKEKSAAGVVIEAMAALITGENEADASLQFASVFEKSLPPTNTTAPGSTSPANEKEKDLNSTEEKENSELDATFEKSINKPEPCAENVLETVKDQQESISLSNTGVEDREKNETVSLLANDKCDEPVIEDSICEEVDANIPKESDNANPESVIEDNICEEVPSESKAGECTSIATSETKQKMNEQTPNVDTPLLQRSLRRLSVDQRIVATTPRRSTRRSSMEASNKEVPKDNNKRTRRASCSAVESQTDVGTPRRKRRLTQEMSTPTRQSKRLLNTPKREFQVDESVGDMGVILEEVGQEDEDQSDIADDGDYGNELPDDEVDKVDYHGLRDLLKTPKNCSTPRFKGLREMMRTPKVPASPILGNMAELLETSVGSTPHPKRRNTTMSRVQPGRTLDGILKTPSARNIMVPNEPASAVLKSREASLAATTEYDLNMTNTTLHLDKIFDDVPETTGANLEDTETEINVTAISTATGVDPLGSSKRNESVSSEALMSISHKATGVASLKDPLTSTTYKAALQADLNLSAITESGSRTTSPNPNEMSGIQLLDQTSDSMFSEALVVSGVESCDFTVDETKASGQNIQPVDNVEDRSDTDSNVGLTEPLVFSDDEENPEGSAATPKKSICVEEPSVAYKIEESANLKSVNETLSKIENDSVTEISLIEVEDTTIEGITSESNLQDNKNKDEKDLEVKLDISKDKESPAEENNETPVVELTIVESEIFALDSTADRSVDSSNVLSFSEKKIVPKEDLKPDDLESANSGDVELAEVSPEKASEEGVSHSDKSVVDTSPAKKCELEQSIEAETNQPPIEELPETDVLPTECETHHPVMELSTVAESEQPVNETKPSEPDVAENKPDEIPNDGKIDQEGITTSPANELSEKTNSDDPIDKENNQGTPFKKHSAESQPDDVSTDGESDQEVIKPFPAEEFIEEAKSDEVSTDAEPNKSAFQKSSSELFEEDKPEEVPTDVQFDQEVIKTSSADELAEGAEPKEAPEQLFEVEGPTVCEADQEVIESTPVKELPQENKPEETTNQTVTETSPLEELSEEAKDDEVPVDSKSHQSAVDTSPSKQTTEENKPDVDQVPVDAEISEELEEKAKPDEVSTNVDPNQHVIETSPCKELFKEDITDEVPTEGDADQEVIETSASKELPEKNKLDDDETTNQTVTETSPGDELSKEADLNELLTDNKTDQLVIETLSAEEVPEETGQQNEPFASGSSASQNVHQDQIQNFNMGDIGETSISDAVDEVPALERDQSEDQQSTQEESVIISSDSEGENKEEEYSGDSNVEKKETSVETGNNNSSFSAAGEIENSDNVDPKETCLSPPKDTKILEKSIEDLDALVMETSTCAAVQSSDKEEPANEILLRTDTNEDFSSDAAALETSTNVSSPENQKISGQDSPKVSQEDKDIKSTPQGEISSSEESSKDVKDVDKKDAEETNQNGPNDASLEGSPQIQLPVTGQNKQISILDESIEKTEDTHAHTEKEEECPPEKSSDQEIDHEVIQLDASSIVEDNTLGESLLPEDSAIDPSKGNLDLNTTKESPTVEAIEAEDEISLIENCDTHQPKESSAFDNTKKDKELDNEESKEEYNQIEPDNEVIQLDASSIVEQTQMDESSVDIVADSIQEDNKEQARETIEEILVKCVPEESFNQNGIEDEVIQLDASNIVERSTLEDFITDNSRHVSILAESSSVDQSITTANLTRNQKETDVEVIPSETDGAAETTMDTTSFNDQEVKAVEPEITSQIVEQKLTEKTATEDKFIDNSISMDTESPNKSIVKDSSEPENCPNTSLVNTDVPAAHNLQSEKEELDIKQPNENLIDTISAPLVVLNVSSSNGSESTDILESSSSSQQTTHVINAPESEGKLTTQLQDVSGSIVEAQENASEIQETEKEVNDITKPSSDAEGSSLLDVSKSLSEYQKTVSEEVQMADQDGAIIDLDSASEGKDDEEEVEFISEHKSVVVPNAEKQAKLDEPKPRDAVSEKDDVITIDDSSSSAQGPETSDAEATSVIPQEESTVPTASTSVSEEPQAPNELAQPPVEEPVITKITDNKAASNNIQEPDTIHEIHDSPASEDLTAQERTDSVEDAKRNDFEMPTSTVLVAAQSSVSAVDAKQSQINSENEPTEESAHNVSTEKIDSKNNESEKPISETAISPESPKKSREPSQQDEKSPDEVKSKPIKRTTRKGSASTDKPAETAISERPKRMARKPSAEAPEVDDAHVRLRGRARKPSADVDDDKPETIAEKRRGRKRTPSVEVIETMTQNQLEAEEEVGKAEEALQPILEEEPESGVEEKKESKAKQDSTNQAEITIEQPKRRGRKASAKETESSLDIKESTKDALDAVSEAKDDHLDIPEQEEPEEPVPVEDTIQEEKTIEKPKRRGRKAPAKEAVTTTDTKEKIEDDLDAVKEVEIQKPDIDEQVEPKGEENTNQKESITEKPKRRVRKASAKETETTLDKKEKPVDVLKAVKADETLQSSQNVSDHSEQETPQEPVPIEALNVSKEEQETKAEAEVNPIPAKTSRRARKASAEDVSSVSDKKHKSEDLHTIEKQDEMSKEVGRSRRRRRKPSAEVVETSAPNDTQEVLAPAQEDRSSSDDQHKLHPQTRKSAEFKPASAQEPAKDDHVERPKRRGRNPSVDIDHVAQEVIEKPKRRGRTPAGHDKPPINDEKQERPVHVVEPEKKTRRNARKASAETVEIVSSEEEHLQQIEETAEPVSGSEPSPVKPPPKEEEEHKTRRRGRKPTTETIEMPIKTNSPEKSDELPTHSRRRGRKATEDEAHTTIDLTESKTKLRGRRASLEHEPKEETHSESHTDDAEPPTKTTRRARKPSADVEATQAAVPEKKPPARRVLKASASVDDGTPVAKKAASRRGRKDETHEDEERKQIDLQDLPTDSVSALVVTSGSPTKAGDAEELTPRRREGRNLPRKNYEEAPDDDKPPSALRRARKPAASKAVANKAPEPEAVTATPVAKPPPVDVEATPDNTVVLPEPTTSQRREGRNLPRKNYTEPPDDDKPASSRGRRVRNLTAKALELIVDSSPRPATPKRAKGKAVDNEEPPAKKATPEVPLVTSAPEEEPAPAAKGRGTRRKAEHSESEPVKKTARATTRKAKVEAEPEEDLPVKKARGRARSKTPLGEPAGTPEEEPVKKPAARSRARGAKTAEPEQPVEDPQAQEAASTSATTGRAGRGRKVHFEAAPEVSTSEDAPKRATRSRRK
ncbi:titin [Drosophila biarmipes]|uniref:titin n=1 Tax=Drosophila biarmipes TaxID=125945 RepID=UPI0007E616AE|nr:titin [Drosophila biarmipes]